MRNLSAEATMGVAPDETINVHDYKILQPLVLAIIAHENGQQPYSDTEIDAGLVLAGVEPPVKPWSQTKTVQGSQVVVGATLAGMSLEAIKDVEPAFPLIQTAMQYAPWFLGLITLASIGYVVWACIDDRNKGLR